MRRELSFIATKVVCFCSLCKPRTPTTAKLKADRVAISASAKPNSLCCPSSISIEPYASGTEMTTSCWDAVDICILCPVVDFCFSGNGISSTLTASESRLTTMLVGSIASSLDTNSFIPGRRFLATILWYAAALPFALRKIAHERSIRSAVMENIKSSTDEVEVGCLILSARVLKMTFSSFVLMPSASAISNLA